MQLKKIRNSILVVLCVGMMLMTLSACSKKISFTTSPVVPAATGYAKVKKDKNDNYAIDISIRDLAPVERLQGDNKVYVVWVTSSGENAKNLGQINSGKGRFSNKLKASFQSVSTYKPTKIFLTAEQNEHVVYPGNIVVLSTENL